MYKVVYHKPEMTQRLPIRIEAPLPYDLGRIFITIVTKRIQALHV